VLVAEREILKANFTSLELENESLLGTLQKVPPEKQQQKRSLLNKSDN
jgi:hypothetical protein